MAIDLDTSAAANGSLAEYASIKKAKKYTVHPTMSLLDAPGFLQFKRNALFASFVLTPFVAASYTTGLSVLSFVIWFAVLLIPTYVAFMVTDSYLKSWAFNLGSEQGVGLLSNPMLSFTRLEKVFVERLYGFP